MLGSVGLGSAEFGHLLETKGQTNRRAKYI